MPFSHPAPGYRVLPRSIRGWAFALLVGTASCGGAGPLPSKPPTVASLIKGDSAPLVVDWPAGPRGDLEAVAEDGVAVVKVEPSKITVLSGCKLDGSYRYLGVTKKEQLIRFDDAGDIAANLPLGGVGIAGEIGADLGASTSLDLALVTVGKRRTPRASAPRSALRGPDCAGATHFVRGFDVGAFALATTENGKASTVASLFTAKAAYARSTAKAIQEKDGDVASCKQGKPGDPAPPAECGAVLRLELKPIDEEEEADTGTCGDDRVRAGGACIAKAKAASASLAYECRPGDDADCRKQCERGNAASCGRLAASLFHSTSAAPDFKQIGEIASQGCDGGSERACIVKGELLQYGDGVGVDYSAAAKLYDRACSAGDALGCFREGALYDRRPGLPRDYAAAAKLYDRACRGGEVDGCNNLGALALAGHGERADAARARAIYEDACKNGSVVACGNLGDLLAAGRGGPPDVARAGSLWEQACTRSGTYCVRLGDALSGAGPLPKDAVRSVAAYQAGLKILAAQCNVGMGDRCDDLAWLFHDGRATPRDDAQALAYEKKGCDLRSPMACNHLGLFLEQGWGGPADPSAAKEKYAASCSDGLEEGCLAMALMSTGSARSTRLEAVCNAGLPAGCYHRGRLLRTELKGDDGQELVQRACGDGYAPACSYFGRWQSRSDDAETRDQTEGYLRKGCDGGDVKGCASLAEALARQGKLDDAAKLANQACAGGVVRACRTLADLHTRGAATEGPSVSPTELLERACDGGDRLACVQLGDAIRAREPGKAATLLQKACDVSGFEMSDLMSVLRDHTVRTGNLVAEALPAGGRIHELGTLSGLGGGATAHGTGGSAMGSSAPQRDTREDRKKARRANLEDAFELASANSQAGCASLGEMYEQGLGFVKDEGRAKLFYLVACSRGDGRGCTRAGSQFDHEKPPKHDLARAAYAAACDLDDGDGCLRAGLADTKSRDALQRLMGAAEMLRACDLGSGEGCYRAGTEALRHADERDDALAMLRHACDAGEPRGCVAAAKIVGKPRKDHPADKELAARLRATACRLGDKSACHK